MHSLLQCADGMDHSRADKAHVKTTYQPAQKTSSECTQRNLAVLGSILQCANCESRVWGWTP